MSLWSTNRERMNESAFWTTHIDEAIGARIQPRLRISFSSPNEKPDLEALPDQRHADHGRERGADRLADDRPLHARAGRDDGDDRDQVEGRARGLDERVGEPASLEPDDHLGELEERPDRAGDRREDDRVGLAGVLEQELRRSGCGR